MDDISEKIVEHFRDDVILAYREESKLIKAVRVDNTVESESAGFPVIKKSGTFKSMSEALAEIQANSFPKKIVHMRNWEYSESIPDFNSSLVNRELLELKSKSMGEAMARTADQLIIDACIAEALPTSNVIGIEINRTVSNINLAKIKQATKIMNDAGIEERGRTLIVSVSQYRELFDILQSINSKLIDYTTGKIKDVGFLRFNLIRIDGKNMTDCFAFHKNAIGLAIEKNFREKIQLSYSKDKDSFCASASASIEYTSNAVVIDPAGVVKISCKE